MREFARKSSYTTHPGPIAAEACAFAALFITRAINRPQDDATSIKDFTDSLVAEYIDLLMTENSEEVLEKPGSGIYEMVKLLRSEEPDHSKGNIMFGG